MNERELGCYTVAILAGEKPLVGGTAFELQWLDQIASFEVGRDLAYLPKNIIKRQKLGAIDPKFEQNGDDRRVRLFMEDIEEPFAEVPDDTPEGPSLMMVLNDALSDFLNQEKFVEFD